MGVLFVILIGFQIFYIPWDDTPIKGIRKKKLYGPLLKNNMERLTPHVQAVNRINTAISTRRNEFVSQYRAGHMGRRALTYEPELDRGVYQTLKEYEHTGTAYEHVRSNLNGY